MGADGFLQLLDVLGPALSKSGLGLTVSLLPLLRGSIDLGGRVVQHRQYGLSLVSTRPQIGEGEARGHRKVGNKQDTPGIYERVKLMAHRYKKT